MAISKEELFSRCEEAIKNPSTFYTKDFIKSDELIDGVEPRTELIAKFIIDNLDAFQSIESIERKKTYKTEGHDGDISFSKATLINEKTLAKLLYRQSQNDGFIFKEIGFIEDYEIPLKNSNDDEGIGKIDLIAINDEKREVYILELKKEGNNESALRCIMEAFTYSKIVRKEKLCKDFGIEDYELKACTLTFKGDKQWEQMQEIKEGKRPYLKELVEKLHVDQFYLVENEDGTFSVIKD